jgi:hypothetical protein
MSMGQVSQRKGNLFIKQLTADSEVKMRNIQNRMNQNNRQQNI